MEPKEILLRWRSGWNTSHGFRLLHLPVWVSISILFPIPSTRAPPCLTPKPPNKTTLQSSEDCCSDRSSPDSFSCPVPGSLHGICIAAYFMICPWPKVIMEDRGVMNALYRNFIQEDGGLVFIYLNESYSIDFLDGDDGNVGD